MNKARNIEHTRDIPLTTQQPHPPVHEMYSETSRSCFAMPVPHLGFPLARSVNIHAARRAEPSGRRWAVSCAEFQYRTAAEIQNKLEETSQAVYTITVQHLAYRSRAAPSVEQLVLLAETEELDNNAD